MKKNLHFAEQIAVVFVDEDGETVTATSEKEIAKLEKLGYKRQAPANSGLVVPSGRPAERNQRKRQPADFATLVKVARNNQANSLAAPQDMVEAAKAGEAVSLKCKVVGHTLVTQTKGDDYGQTRLSTTWKGEERQFSILFRESHAMGAEISLTLVETDNPAIRSGYVWEEVTTL